MNDERAVEVIEQVLLRWDDSLASSREGAEAALAALRAEGFDLYRPDECHRAKIGWRHWFDEDSDIELVDPNGKRWITDPNAVGTYRLVPVGGEG